MSRRRRRPSRGSRARPGTACEGVGDQRARWRRGRGRACPRCRPAPGRRRSRARAAGAPGSSRTPGGRTGRARCGSCRGRRRRRGAARASRPSRRASAPPAAGPSRSRAPEPVTTSSADDVVGGAAVAQRPGPAGVVADHPADGAAVVRARVGAEAQPVRPRPRACSAAWTTPGSTTGGARLGVDVAARGPGAGWCRRRRPGPTALPAIEVPAPRAVSGTPRLPADLERRDDLVGVPGRTTARGSTR